MNLTHCFLDMKKLFYLFLLFATSLLYSQKYVDAVVIKSNNDTIKAKMKISTNIFYSDLLNETSFMRTVRLSDENGKKLGKINAKDIKKLSFSFNDKERIYKGEGKQLEEVMYLGKKIKWYRAFYQNIYDGSIQYHDYMIGEDGQKYAFGAFSNSKKRLLEITRNKPELAKDIEETKKFSDENILSIIKKFEE